jgi:peptide/nickel transport system ATP-binding protein
MASQGPLLQIKDLQVTFSNGRRQVPIIDHVSFSLLKNEIVGLVGESGSGKTVTSLAVMGFLPPAGNVEGGEIWFKGQDLLSLNPKKIRQIRGREIAMIFQSSRSALNPLMQIGDQIARVFQIQLRQTYNKAYAAGLDLLKQVRISDAESRARAYPHQLSGGMAQRVLIAMMIACKPTLLIADEPTTGLDVTIQAQIFELLKDVQESTGTTVLLITHDLGVVAEVCERVVVMFAGQVMEVAPVKTLFVEPRHPYTRLLMRTVLRADRLVEMPGPQTTPSEETTYSIRGCRFAPRCPVALTHCWQEPPPRDEAGDGHLVMCHNWKNGNSG